MSHTFTIWTSQAGLLGGGLCHYLGRPHHADRPQPWIFLRESLPSPGARPASGNTGSLFQKAIKKFKKIKKKKKAIPKQETLEESLGEMSFTAPRALSSLSLGCLVTEPGLGEVACKSCPHPRPWRARTTAPPPPRGARQACRQPLDVRGQRCDGPESEWGHLPT